MILPNLDDAHAPRPVENSTALAIASAVHLDRGRRRIRRRSATSQIPDSPTGHGF